MEPIAAVVMIEWPALCTSVVTFGVSFTGFNGSHTPSDATCSVPAVVRLERQTIHTNNRISRRMRNTQL